MQEYSVSSTKIIDYLSKVIGERDIALETVKAQVEEIKNWDVILEHQKNISQFLHSDISIQSALLDYLLSREFITAETHPLDLSPSQKITYTTIIDPLTGLYNEKSFQIIVEAGIKRAKEYRIPQGLIMLDADNFGAYTALYGRETGEIALKEIALILKKSCRKEDLIFHLGRNKFALLLLNIDREGAHMLGERLMGRIGSFHFKGEEKMPTKKLTASGGISIYPEDGKNAQTLIMAAEEALSTAKQSGKNRILEYTTKRRKKNRMELTLEAKYEVEGRDDIKPQTVYIKNLSESGVLVKAMKNLPLGGAIILRFRLQNGTPLNIKGETVRISRKEGTNEISAAIKFVDLTEQDILNIRNHINGKAK